MIEPTAPVITPPATFAVKVTTLDAIALYLGERPYREVAHLMRLIEGSPRIETAPIPASPNT